MTADLFAGFAPPVKVPDGTALDFQISRQELEKVLGTASSIVPTKHFIPVLTNYHFQVKDGDLRVTGTDSVLSIVQHTPVYATKVEGAAVFPSSKMLSVVRDAGDDFLHIRVVVKKEKYFATVKTNSTTWTLSLEPPGVFPTFVEHENVKLLETNRLAFYEALQRVRKCASTDPMRPYLMLVDTANGKMRASDSHRFQQIKFQFPIDCQIPVHATQDLSNRLASSNLENVEVGQTDNALLFRFGKVLVIAQKSGYVFPDVDEVMLKPTLANDQDLTVSRKDLQAAIKRTRITADEDTSAIVLSLNKGSVTVQTKDHRGGTAIESIEAVWDHPPRHIAFNHQQLTDLLSSTDSDTCVFRLGKDLKTRPSPLLMEDVKKGFTAVLSQIRIDWME